MSAVRPLDDTLTSGRWPLRPLLDATGLTRTALARRLNLGGQLADAVVAGLSDTLADEWATRLGRHPVEVWGWDWVTAGLSPDRKNRLPSVERLTDHLREQIDRGHLAPGETLPTIRALAAQWGVGPNTVSRAVRTLREEGRVTSGSGQPIRVAGRPVHACAVCGTRIDAGTEHYPPGYLRRRTVHPACCACAGGDR